MNRFIGWNCGIVCGVALAGLVAFASPALAGGGNVMPASANPKGYSLAQSARAAAVFNTGQQVGNPLTPPPPDVPFEVLVGDATLSPGTMIYLPIFDADNSGPADPNFPANIADQQADAEYLDALVAGLGVDAFVVQVDGKITVLDDDFIVGVKTAPLLDGAPAGNEYIAIAAFLTPLTPGHHTIGIGGLIGDEPVIFLSYNVAVK